MSTSCEMFEDLTKDSFVKKVFTGRRVAAFMWESALSVI